MNALGVSSFRVDVRPLLVVLAAWRAMPAWAGVQAPGPVDAPQGLYALQKLDTAGPLVRLVCSPTYFQTFNLEHRDLDSGREAAMRMLIGSRGRLAVVDQKRRIVYVYADQETHHAIEGILTLFDVAPAGNPNPAPAEKKNPDSRRPPEKAAAFEFHDAPWSRVLEWLADSTGVPVSSPPTPVGTFTFIPPRPHKKYTVTEIIDILNHALHIQKIRIIRRPASFNLIWIDQKIDKVGFFSPEQLDDLDRSEIIRIAFPLKAAQAKEVAPLVKKMLSRFGEVIVLETVNSLFVQDSVENLRRIRKMLLDLDHAAEKTKNGRRPAGDSGSK